MSLKLNAKRSFKLARKLGEEIYSIADYLVIDWFNKNIVFNCECQNKPRAAEERCVKKANLIVLKKGKNKASKGQILNEQTIN